MKIINSASLALLYLAMFSCSSPYYQETDFYSIKKIDAHIHIRNANDAIAEQAATDVFQLVNVSVGHNDSTLQVQEKFTLYQLTAHPDQIHYITAFTMNRWDSIDWAEQTINKLKVSFSNGALGIKLWKNIGMVDKDAAGNFIMIDDPRFDPVIQFIIDQNKTVMGHLGEPRNCWLPLDQMTVNNDRTYFKNHPEYHMFLHPDYPSYEAQINARDRFLARHPDMRFVGAHLGSLEYAVDSLASRLDRFTNMSVDMAARVCHLQYQTKTHREKVRQFMIKYQDRLLYGTDQVIRESVGQEEAKTNLHEHWMEDWKYFTSDDVMKVDEVDGEFRGLQLPKKVIDKIYYLNSVKWFGIEE